MHGSVISVLQLVLCSSILALPNAQPTTTVPDTNNNIGNDASVYFTGYKNNEGTLVAEEATEDPASPKSLQERGAAIAIAFGLTAIAGTARLTMMAIETGADTIKGLGEWTETREAFTKETTLEMRAVCPDYARFPAAVCYNKGWSLKNENGYDGLLDVELSLGLLHTDYDCMYLEANNTFYTHSEGGYINLAYRYDTTRCVFDDPTGDLFCGA